MAKEKNGYNIEVEFTPDAGTLIAFAARGKQRPGFKGDPKVDMTTDKTGPIKEYEPGDKYEITEGSVTIIDDFDVVETIRLNLNKKGLLEFKSSWSTKKVPYPDSWIREVIPGGTDNEGNPTCEVKFDCRGGDSDAPIPAAIV